MKNSKKITLIFIASVSVIMMIAGCSPRRVSDNRITNPQTGNKKEVRTIYQNTLTSLVANGTITQAQSDRVLNEVTNKDSGMINQNQNINQAITPRNANDGSITSNQANNQVGTETGARTGTMTGTGTRIQNGAATPNGTVNPNGTVTPSEAVTPNGTRTGTQNDITNTTRPTVDLSQLVKDGTITQTQANIINQRVTETMKNNR